MRQLIITERSNLVTVADAVRNRTGETEQITLGEMVGDINVITGEAILQDKTVTPTKNQQIISADEGYNGLNDVTVNAIPDDYIVTTDATATSSDVISGKTAYVNGEKVVGTIPTQTSFNLTANGATVTVPSGYYASQATKSVLTTSQAVPSISVDADGLITASTTQSEGYVTAGTKSATQQLNTQAAKTITPSVTQQTAVASGVYTTGAVTVAGDANLKAENIAEGVSIFGVEGAHTGGVDTSDATASADEIMAGETAYVNGEKVTGTFSIDSELDTQATLLSEQDAKIAELAEILSNKASALPVLQSKTITPTTATQIVTADDNYDGLRTVTVNGDSNLIAKNIAEGVSIFGVSGTHSGGGVQTASVYVDATNGTTFKYIGANGLETLVNTATTVQMTVPSMAFAIATDYFYSCSVENNGSIIFNNQVTACIYIDDSTRIFVQSFGGGGGAGA